MVCFQNLFQNKLSSFNTSRILVEFSVQKMSESLLICSNGKTAESSSKLGLLRLPHSKVRSLMKVADPSIGSTGSEASFVLAKATELFIGKIGKNVS